MVIDGRFPHSKINTWAQSYLDIFNTYGERQAVFFIQFYVPEQLQKQVWQRITELWEEVSEA